ncbi:L-ribulose-5-phosphate 4-epimerase [Breznakia pachnodae]|uniref:L-ribulose-5-phosphate 4-epimerase n=1 Tax=Breznakia pachnodae TaxID=265178 RepID=A0ABU0E910_9FIRM|nr:L-ribulose-5-phosphate 4-epimerase [Breznakia pachnodae]MDQ0363188.1 L-ribulose-5-phosphate 4-epimerase [Breznakia pachnodae]
MYQKLKEKVLKANLLLPKYNLITFTWGNVSEIDRKRKVIAIKPSGVEYENMQIDDVVVCDLQGNVIEGNLKPSSDLMTHIELYKHFENINGIVHTHSRWATVFAQAGFNIPVYGTTQADYFFGDIPCTRLMSKKEINENYEKETGKVIVETFRERKLSPDNISGVLVHSHGPFVWGIDCMDAVYKAVVMEECAQMAYATITLNRDVANIQEELLDKHFKRKHGPNAYYGQK